MFVRLFSRVCSLKTSNSNTTTAFGATTSQAFSSRGCFHSGTKAVGPSSLASFGLVSYGHGFTIQDMEHKSISMSSILAYPHLINIFKLLAQVCTIKNKYILRK